MERDALPTLAILVILGEMPNGSVKKPSWMISQGESFFKTLLPLDDAITF
jgi:hypothetical protein